MVWGAIAAAAGSIAGSVLDKNSAKKAAKKQFQYNKALQQMNIDWEKEQHLNNHQWEVQDLEKAGLNPILSAGGSSAGSISGASQSTSPGNVQTDFGSKISQLMQMKQMNSASKLQDQQADLAQQQGKLAQSQANKINKEAGWIDPQAQADIKQKNSASAKMIAEAEQNRAQSELLHSERDLTKEKIVSEKINQSKSMNENQIISAEAEIKQADAKMLRTIGFTRSELVGIGQQVIDKAVDLIKDGKTIEAEQIIKRAKDGTKVLRTTHSAKY